MPQYSPESLMRANGEGGQVEGPPFVLSGGEAGWLAGWLEGGASSVKSSLCSIA